MKLFHATASPYVRKVMVTAHELGLVDRLELVTAPSTPLEPNPDLIARNPLGKIPVLVTDDAGTLFDSRVICRYLNHAAAGTLLGPNAAEFPIIGREAMAEGMIDAMLAAVYETRFRGQAAMQAWIDAQIGKARRGMQAFDARIDDVSGSLTIDQITLGVALGYADFRHGNLGWRDDCPALAAWYETFSVRPSMQATMPE